MREVAATFVDIVKFAMRGLPAPTVASFGEGFLVGGQQPRSSDVSRLSRARDVSFLFPSLRVASAASSRRLAAAPYPLIGKEAPDFALHALVGQQRAAVRASGRRRGRELLGQPVRALWHAARCTQSQSLDVSVGRACSVFGVSVDDDQVRALEYAKGQSVSFPLLLDPSEVGEPCVSGGQPADDACSSIVAAWSVTCIATTARRMKRCTCKSCVRC